MTWYNPSVVVLMGGTAIKAVFGTSAKVGETRAEYRYRVTGEDFKYGKRVWVPTYHPASLLPVRRPQHRSLVIEDLLLAKELLVAGTA